MVLPFSNAQYKDKPLPKRWKLKLHNHIHIRRFAVISVLLVTIWFFSDWLWQADVTATSRYSDYYGDEDLSVDTRLFPPGLGISLKRAILDVKVHPIQNVFFLLDGLTDSDTELVAIGCQMHSAMAGATVHFVVLGGGRTTIDEYREINQFGSDHCQAYFHDARPRSKLRGRESSHLYASYAANSINFVAGHHSPKAFIYTHSASAPKPNWFLAALQPFKDQTTHIELSRQRLAHLGWIAQLSPTSLNAWNKPRIDLVVQASSNTASLERLFQSLISAQYPADQYPNLLVNFDHESSESARYIATELSRIWPVESLILRRRIERSENSILEEWYPASKDNYAVILSDQWELSPHFYHYLRSMILRYRYGIPGRMSTSRDRQIGLSLQSIAAEGLLDSNLQSHEKSQMPVLWNHANLSAPFLILPDPFIAFHEARAASKFNEPLQDALTTFVREGKLVTLYPPRFQYDDGEFVLARHHPISRLPDLEVDHLAEAGNTLQTAQQAQLLENQDWWKRMGNDRGYLSTWQEMKLFREDGSLVTNLVKFYDE